MAGVENENVFVLQLSLAAFNNSASFHAIVFPLSLSASHLVPPSLHVCVATAVIIIIGDVGCVACMMHGDVKGQTHNTLLFV